MDLVYGAIVYTVAALFEYLTAWKTALIARTVLARLAKNNVTITASTTLTNLTQAVFGGYAPVAVTNFNGPFIDGAGQPYMVTNVCDFQANGSTSPDNIYSVYLTGSTGAAATATATLTAEVITGTTITPNTIPYQVAPIITVSGGAGSGAVLTAVLTAGILTGITIVNGGAGYTSVPTITIEAPCELIGGYNLPAARSMGMVTDGLPAVVQLA
jgi:hypothetical protein